MKLGNFNEVTNPGKMVGDGVVVSNVWPSNLLVKSESSAAESKEIMIRHQYRDQLYRKLERDLTIQKIERYTRENRPNQDTSQTH